MAEYMPWKSSYSVGDDSIDAQHKRIVALVNSLHTSLQTPGGADRGKVKQVLEDLVYYTIQHFDHEERLMRECGYPDLDNHRALHIRLRLRTIAMRNNLELVTERDMLGYVKDWWNNHIMEQDRAYAPYVAMAMSEDY
jgi:hemerythrin-like metal-binding protein